MNVQRYLTKLLLALAVMSFAIATGSAAEAVDAADEAGCQALLHVNNLTIISADIRTLRNSTTPYCYVRGLIEPAIHYHVQLPLPKNWNERYIQWGDGGTD